MKILVLKVSLRASWVHSLKEKRMIVSSVCQKLKNKFNVSVSEVEAHDDHQNIIIGIVALGTSGKIIDALKESIIDFIEKSTDAELINIEDEIIQF